MTSTGTKKLHPQQQPSQALGKCRYRLDNDTSATLVLPDGRDLGYSIYGAEDGHPIFFLHGLPGSRIEGAHLDEHAANLGARIIAVDRPGFGWSTPQPNRKILDHPQDVKQLAEHLGLNEYGLIGVSGGGPYALACAASLPFDKLKAVAIVCGLGPPECSNRGMDWAHLAGFPYGYRYFPRLCRWWFKSDAGARLDLSDEQRLELFQKQLAKANLHKQDVELLKDVDILRLSLRGTREAFAQGFDGMLLDGKLMCTDLGFRVEDIRSDLPMRLWYGKLDTSVPPIHGKQIAARIGSNAHLRLLDETHWGIFKNNEKEMLEDLLESLQS